MKVVASVMAGGRATMSGLSSVPMTEEMRATKGSM